MRSDVAYGVEQMSALNSETMIIRSRTVINSTVDSLGVPEEELPTEDAGWLTLLIESLSGWMLDVGLREPITPREQFFNTIEENLRVEPLPNSNVIKISFKGENPEQSAKIINAIMHGYIQHHLKIFSSAGTSEVYRQQIKRLGQELDRKQKELATYKRKQSVSALNETRSAMVRQQTRLTKELSNTLSALAELQTRYGQGHTKVTLVEEKERNIRFQLIETKSKLQNLELQQEKIRDMELGISSIEKTHQDYQRRYEEERLSSLANPDVVNVRIIEYAETPSRPNHSRFFYIILAIIGGFILSLAIAFIKEYFDHRVSDPDEVARMLGVPTLGFVEKF